MAVLVSGSGGGGKPYTGDNPLTIGQEGYTFPAKTLIKEALQIINGVKSEGEFVWKQLTAEGGDFVAFVTADNEDSYPNKGTQDGYYYVKFDPLTAIAENIRKGVSIFDIVGTMVGGLDLSGMGFSKCAIDKFSFSSRTSADGKQISHSLGEIPRLVVLIGKDVPDASSTYNMFSAIGFNSGYAPMYAYCQYKEMYTSYKAGTPSPVTNKVIAFNTGTMYYPAGVEYTMITIA